MVDEPPFAQLPDEICLSREELAAVLFAVDVVDEAEVDAEDASKVQRAIRLLTMKLWHTSDSERDTTCEASISSSLVEWTRQRAACSSAVERVG